jgi:hypothetical protein
MATRAENQHMGHQTKPKKRIPPKMEPQENSGKVEILL